MQDLSRSSIAFILVLFCACANQPVPDNTPPEDVLIKWQGFVDQDMYDSAFVYSTGEASEFVRFLQSITGQADDNRVMSITLLRNLVCTVQGDSAICAYYTKDEIGNDVADTVILKRIRQRWLVARVYDAGAPPLDSLLDGEENLVFPGDSLDEEYQ